MFFAKRSIYETAELWRALACCQSSSSSSVEKLSIGRSASAARASMNAQRSRNFSSVADFEAEIADLRTTRAGAVGGRGEDAGGTTGAGAVD